ncbi:hypothetical protein [Streptomyces sp. NPDC101115]|uniref:hypothetical protein n=1 Tax=Streptomyces sp. NPDC101115 TaxID=3366106 RepID=UPI003804EC3E
MPYDHDDAHRAAADVDQLEAAWALPAAPRCAHCGELITPDGPGDTWFGPVPHRARTGCPYPSTTSAAGHAALPEACRPCPDLRP